MKVRFNCQCGKEFIAAQELQGKAIRCKQCGALVKIPPIATPQSPEETTKPAPNLIRAEAVDRPAAAAVVVPTSNPAPNIRKPAAPEPDISAATQVIPQITQPIPPRSSVQAANPAPSAYRPRKNRREPNLLLVAVIAACSVSFILFLFAALFFGQAAWQRGNEIREEMGLERLDEPAVAQQPANSHMPPRPQFFKSFPSGVQNAFTSFQGTGPAERTQMNIYFPSGTHSAASLGCVLVAPAGTNLLMGNALDGADYHDETLPYAEAGFLAIQYSLDGSADLENITYQQFGQAYQQFRAARAGTLNAQRVIEFVKARFPEVDPGRIYVAGHSSAGTVSLLNAALLGEVAACVAYAPCTDPETWHEDVYATDVMSVLPGVRAFDRQFSPLRNVQQIQCPLFVFQARDDTVVDFRETKEFVRQAQENNPRVEYLEIGTGNHYQSMIDDGIPRAIEWLQRIDAQFQ